MTGAEDQSDEYLETLRTEIANEPPWRALDSLYFGGGTPTRWGAHRLNRVVALIRERFGFSSPAEISLEANPEDWTPELSEALLAGGFTRVSFGAQSFDQAVLEQLGRHSRPAQIIKAVSQARADGWASISLDLIYGSPAEDQHSWKTTLDQALSLTPDHLSVYGLTVEPGTEWWRKVRAGELPDSDSDREAERWEEAQIQAEAAGFERYEVSNLAQPGHQCRYNLSVWGQGSYLGFGVGAHSYRNQIRRVNIRRFPVYMDRINNQGTARQNQIPIVGWEAETERMMLGLRRSVGVELGIGGLELLASDRGKRLLEYGVISVSDHRLMMRKPLLTDMVIREILALPSPKTFPVGIKTSFGMKAPEDHHFLQAGFPPVLFTLLVFVFN